MSLEEKYIKRNPEETVRLILAAATKEFTEKGFAGARVDIIAKSSGINKGMIYYYFKNKEGLYNAVLEQQFCKKSEMSNSESNDILEIILNWVDHCREEPGFIRLMQWEALERGQAEIVSEETRTKIFRHSHEEIAEMQKQGIIPADLDAELAHLLYMAFNWFPYAFPQVTKMVTGMDANSDQYHQRQKEFLKQITHKLLNV